MREVRIYHSSWLDYVFILLGIIVFFAFPFPSSDIFIVLVWTAYILLTMVVICRIVRSKILEYPTLIITDEYVKFDTLWKKV